MLEWSATKLSRAIHARKIAPSEVMAAWRREWPDLVVRPAQPVRIDDLEVRLQDRLLDLGEPLLRKAGHARADGAVRFVHGFPPGEPS